MEALMNDGALRPDGAGFAVSRSTAENGRQSP